MNRQEILKAAEDCVCRDRQATHGAPENSFGKLAAVWSARLGIDITPAQTTICCPTLRQCAHGTTRIMPITGWTAWDTWLAAVSLRQLSRNP